ncbi:MAG: hypothetical protein Q7T56_07665 [Nocardioidaceae bacterium]|nr:hypothetical protein [Nocardioidaceae bacterium]
MSLLEAGGTVMNFLADIRAPTASPRSTSTPRRPAPPMTPGPSNLVVDKVLAAAGDRLDLLGPTLGLVVGSWRAATTTGGSTPPRHSSASTFPASMTP